MSLLTIETDVLEQTKHNSGTILESQWKFLGGASTNVHTGIKIRLPTSSKTSQNIKN